MAFFLFIPTSSPLEFTVAFARQRQVFVRCFGGFLDEAMKDEDFALLHAEQDACDPIRPWIGKAASLLAIGTEPA
jgi:hypothetical protein